MTAQQYEPALRDARLDDAEEAARVVVRSITELCTADHRNDPDTIALWTANKTAANMRRWIEASHVVVAVDDLAILGVASMTREGIVTLNYVLPSHRLRGISKALITRLEVQASDRGLHAISLESTQTALRLYKSVGFE